MKLVYATAAVADLTRLRAFIAEHDPAAAARIAANLLARIEQLRHFPDIGRAVPEAPTLGSVRDFVFGPYIVRYSARADTVVVLRIWHHFENRSSA